MVELKLLNIYILFSFFEMAIIVKRIYCNILPIHSVKCSTVCLMS